MVDLNHHTTTTPSQSLWQPHRRRLTLLRRRKVQSVQLGGKRSRRRMVGLVRIFKRLRLKWLKLKYLCMLKKLKEYYKNLMKDLVEGAATIETFHQRLLMESSSFAMPLGVSSFSTYPSRLGSDCPRTIFI
ncbi:PREDICTED: uncharacterized protein LOC109328680 [Lupinus angustifolius]|uniref:uncharacterized protein LOC109328680 n=1 Tax=Lupinus angustifolius TaxID=3871 RepID=UPI00092FD823|nr:PREDICTED: uncharacterized protein LOC109328680 [Lupinus angustifolius]